MLSSKQTKPTFKRALNMKHKNPYDRIKEMGKSLPATATAKIKLPKKWELLGDIVVLKMEKNEYEKEIGEIYGKVLHAKTVVVDESIEGTTRKPRIRIIYGNDPETVAKENNLSYKMDVSKVMFSSGNKKERMRMKEIVSPDERVLDMFAGIGYFSIPMGKKAEVYACEINEDVYNYLKENIRLNHVNVKPFLGDNREIVPRLSIKFTRIVMGYLRDTYDFLPCALSVLEKNGMVHYHEALKEGKEHETIERLSLIAEKHGRKIVKERMNRIKSIAPGIIHYVFDLKIN